MSIKKHFKDVDLFALGPQKTYRGDSLREIVFPLGGVGTGFMGLTGYGGFKDVSIFNRPNFGPPFPFTFPLLYAKQRGKDPVCRIVRGPVPPPYHTSSGTPHLCGEGFPHMDDCTFRGEYPFAYIDFASRKLPVKVSLEGYSPFIPSEPDASGYPAAILTYTLTNKTSDPVDATLAWSFLNAVGGIGEAARDAHCNVEWGHGGNINEYREERGIRGLFFHANKWDKDHPRFGSMALTTSASNVTVQRYWMRAAAFAEAQHELWDAFSMTGLLPDHDYGPSEEGTTTPGTLGVRVKLAPKQSKAITFYFTWYFPNFEMYWGPSQEGCCGKAKKTVTWPNYYASQFADAFDVAAKLHKNESKLHTESRRFHDLLFSTTMPPQVLDAVSSQLAVLKSATVIRLTDGTFWAWEGSSASTGCCDGSCTHVWNYQQALPFIFPSLERSMREADYRYNPHEDGRLGFRLQLPLGTPPWDYHACVDGQLGGVIKTYRDWKICGDNAWLRSLWPEVKKALEYAWVQWDADKDGVIEGVQHNTYDIEFVGPNPLSAGFYYGALTAAAEMAHALGEAKKAAEYRALAQKGAAWVDTSLFNGEYYEQRYRPEDAPKFQFGAGCLSDQLLGQWMTQVAGLGHVLDPKHIKKTLASIVRYNWLPSMREHACGMILVCALNDDAGLVLCSWPKGGKPRTPVAYYDEVWAGIEYQVASHCILEGLVEEGLGITKAARDRHDGILRNPWDHFECCGGHHYSRCMSSYGLLLALSGFRYDKGAGMLGFAPALHQDRFQTFWSLDGAWGEYRQGKRSAEITVAWGAMKLCRLELTLAKGMQSVTASVAGKAVECALKNGILTLKKPAVLKSGDSLRLQFKAAR